MNSLIRTVKSPKNEEIFIHILFYGIKKLALKKLSSHVESRELIIAFLQDIFARHQIYAWHLYSGSSQKVGTKHTSQLLA